MQKYLTYLLQDIAAAARAQNDILSPDLDDMDTHFAEVERYLHERPSVTLAQHTGLAKIEFSPADRLTDEQCNTLINALQCCFETYNIALDIPKGVPVKNAYRAVIKTLDDPVFAMNLGTCHIDFCT